MCSRRQTAPTAGQSQKLSSIRSSRRRQGGWSCASEGNPTIRNVHQRRLERAFSQRAGASLPPILSLPQTAPTVGQSKKLSSIKSSRRRQGGWSCASEGNPTIRHVDNQRRLERAFSQRANASLSLILSLPHVSHRLPWTNAACLARAAQRVVLTALRQSMPGMRKAQVPAAAARVVGIFLCPAYRCRAPRTRTTYQAPWASACSSKRRPAAGSASFLPWSAVFPPLSPKQFDAYLLWNWKSSRKSGGKAPQSAPPHSVS